MVTSTSLLSESGNESNEATSSSQLTSSTNTTSPIKPTALLSIHAKIAEELDSSDLASPVVKKAILKLNRQHETLVAEHTIVRHQLEAVTEVISVRKERKNTKRIVFKDRAVISVQEIVDKLVEHQRQMNSKQTRTRGGRSRPRKQQQIVHVEVDGNDGNEVDESRDMCVKIPRAKVQNYVFGQVACPQWRSWILLTVLLHVLCPLTAKK